MRALLVVTVLAIPAFAKAKDAAAYSSKAGLFTAKFNGKPREASTRIATEAGDLTVTTTSYSESSKLLLSVTHVDYPPRFNLVNKAAVLDAVRDGLKTQGAKIISEIIADTHREVTINHGKYVTRTRLVLNDTRLYQITVTGTPDQIESRIAETFLKSFAITK